MRCLIGLQKGVSWTSKGHLLQANWASFQSQKSIIKKLVCEINLQSSLMYTFFLLASKV